MAAVTAVVGEFVHRPVHLSDLMPILKAYPPLPTLTDFGSLSVHIQSIYPPRTQHINTIFLDTSVGLILVPADTIKHYFFPAASIPLRY